MKSVRYRPLFIALFSLAALFCVPRAVAQNNGVRVVVIDAGHGGKDPGACYKNLRESDLNLKVALKLGALIEQELPQVRVVYTRKTDKHLFEEKARDLQARADIANKAQGDLFISIHANAAPSASPRGVETLIMGESPLEQNANERALYANNREELIDMSNERTAAIVRAYIQNLQFTYGEYSEAMARLVQKHYVQANRHNRGVKRQPLQVLYATDMPGILTEIGFLSNEAEYLYLNSDKGQGEIARAIFLAVKDYTAYVQGALLVEDDAKYEQAAPETAPEQIQPEAAAAPKAVQAGPYYAVQLLSSTRPVPLRDSQFRSYRGKVEECIASGNYKYKYCVGRFADRRQAEAKLAEVRKEFRDAFVVRCENGKIKGL